MYKMYQKNNGATTDHAEDLDLVMSIYNLIEYSSNQSKATGRLQFYSKDEATHFNADIANDNNLSNISLKYQETLKLSLFQIILMEF